MVDHLDGLNDDLASRVCPGMLVAQAQAFATMACVLAAFDLKAPKDDFGSEIIPETKSVDSLIK